MELDIHDDIREPLIIINLSLPRRRESSDFKSFWIPAFAGMTLLEAAISLIRFVIPGLTEPALACPVLDTGYLIRGNPRIYLRVKCYLN